LDSNSTSNVQTVGNNQRGGITTDIHTIKRPIREEEFLSHQQQHHHHTTGNHHINSNMLLPNMASMNTLSSNIQYHVLDPGRGGIGGGGGGDISCEEYDDEEDTITDELTDDTNQNTNTNNNNNSSRSHTGKSNASGRNQHHYQHQKLQQHSPNDSCNFSDTSPSHQNHRLVDTSVASMINKQFIQARIVKTLPDSANQQQPPAVPTNPPPSTSMFNKIAAASYDHTFNSTLNSSDNNNNNNGGDTSIFLSNKVSNVSTTAPNNNARQQQSANMQMMNGLGSMYGRDNYTRLMTSGNNNTSTFGGGGQQTAGGHAAVNTSQNQNSSILSKSTTNMTNITPLASDLNLNQHSFNHEDNSANTSGGLMSEEKTSDYENISTTALNDILKNYSNNNSSRQPFSGTTTFQPRQQQQQNLIPTSPSRFRPPPPTPPQPPSGLFQPVNVQSNVKSLISKLSSGGQRTQQASVVRPVHGPQAEYTDTDDAESMLSCQLITSASLLANRDVVKEARRVVEPNGKRQMLPPPMPPPPMPKPSGNKSNGRTAPNILNPRSFIYAHAQSQVVIDEATQTCQAQNQQQVTLFAHQPQQQQQQQFSQRSNISVDSNGLLANTSIDVAKPPPMETTI
jgi:hypothetical protein